MEDHFLSLCCEICYNEYDEQITNIPNLFKNCGHSCCNSCLIFLSNNSQRGINLATIKCFKCKTLSSFSFKTEDPKKPIVFNNAENKIAMPATPPKLPIVKCDHKSIAPLKFCCIDKDCKFFGTVFCSLCKRENHSKCNPKRIMEIKKFKEQAIAHDYQINYNNWGEEVEKEIKHCVKDFESNLLKMARNVQKELQKAENFEKELSLDSYLENPIKWDIHFDPGVKKLIFKNKDQKARSELSSDIRDFFKQDIWVNNSILLNSNLKVLIEDPRWIESAKQPNIKLQNPDPIGKVIDFRLNNQNPVLTTLRQEISDKIRLFKEELNFKDYKEMLQKEIRANTFKIKTEKSDFDKIFAEVRNLRKISKFKIESSNAELEGLLPVTRSIFLKMSQFEEIILSQEELKNHHFVKDRKPFVFLNADAIAEINQIMNAFPGGLKQQFFRITENGKNYVLTIEDRKKMFELNNPKSHFQWEKFRAIEKTLNGSRIEMLKWKKYQKALPEEFQEIGKQLFETLSKILYVEYKYAEYCSVISKAKMDRLDVKNLSVFRYEVDVEGLRSFFRKSESEFERFWFNETRKVKAELKLSEKEKELTVLTLLQNERIEIANLL